MGVVLVLGLSTLVGGVDCLMSHKSMLTSVVCPKMSQRCVFERPRAAVAPGWSPIPSSRIVALGSMSVLL